MLLPTAAIATVSATGNPWKAIGAPSLMRLRSKTAEREWSRRDLARSMSRFDGQPVVHEPITHRVEQKVQHPTPCCFLNPCGPWWATAASAPQVRISRSAPRDHRWQRIHCYVSSRIQSDTCSPIMMHVRLMFARGIAGITDPSTTRRFGMPRSRQCWSTTAI
jgi:hypothetical protein